MQRYKEFLNYLVGKSLFSINLSVCWLIFPFIYNLVVVLIDYFDVEFGDGYKVMLMYSLYNEVVDLIDDVFLFGNNSLFNYCFARPRWF